MNTNASRRKIQYRAISDDFIRQHATKLTPSQLAVLMALMGFHGPGKGGLVWPRLKTLGERAGISRRQTVSDAAKSLADLGLIDIVDWQLYTSIGASKMRDLGGGRGSGRGFVYRLLHVDEAGVLHGNPVRPSVQQLLDFDRHKNESTGEVVTLLNTDPPRSIVCSAMRQRWPALADYPFWNDLGDDSAWCEIGWDDITIGAIRGHNEAIDAQWPGEDAALCELTIQNPAGMSHAELGRVVMGTTDMGGMVSAVEQSWDSIFKELPILDQRHGDRRLGLDIINLWERDAPHLARVSKRFRVGPRFAVANGHPDDAEIGAPQRTNKGAPQRENRCAVA